jgi:hypothetical protein
VPPAHEVVRQVVVCIHLNSSAGSLLSLLGKFELCREGRHNIQHQPALVIDCTLVLLLLLLLWCTKCD